MSDKFVLDAEKRTEFGKGASRRARADHKIPAVLYGHGEDPVHVLLPGHATMMALKTSNALLTVALPDEEHMAIARDVQRDPVRRTIDHVDLLLVRKGEKIVVDIAVHLVGESAPGTIHIMEQGVLSVRAEATNLPEFVEVSLEGLDDGDKVLAGDITLPAGSELETDPEQLIAAVTVPRQEAEVEETDADAPAEAAAADAPADADAPAEDAE